MREEYYLPPPKVKACIEERDLVHKEQYQVCIRETHAISAFHNHEKKKRQKLA